MTAPVTSGEVASRTTLWDAPIALWVYAVTRAAAFAAPSMMDGGSVGLGVVVVMVLFVFVVRRSRGAYYALVALDVFSHVMLMTVWRDTADAPLSVPLLAAASFVALLWPSIRRWVAPPPTAATASTGASTATHPLSTDRTTRTTKGN